VPSYFYKKPSPAIVYNIGQAEQYGFYKKISMYSSPYDTDMAKEIVNPERIQSGTLDFALVVLFLMPVLLLVLLYNLKAQEEDEGFLNLVFVQTGTKNWWILSRTLFYSILLLVVLLGLLFYGSFLTGVFNAGSIFWVVFREISIYLLFWVGIYFIILKCSKSIISNTLLMIGTWLFFAFIIPAAVHQWISIEKPTSLMVDLIDVKRDKTDEIYEQSNSDTDKQIIELYPALKQTKIAHDTIGIVKTRRASKIALVNTAMKMAIFEFESENKSRNKLVETTYWINPITYFQNKLNHSSKTHYDDYHTYRKDIQYLIDKRIETMVLDIWNDVKVDKSKYLNYNKLFALY
jgi:ABC-2 type transport system permease protein